MASTTIDLDTELSAVNSILGAIGQAPVTSLVYDNPEIAFIYNLLRDANVDTQAERLAFQHRITCKIYTRFSYRQDSYSQRCATA